VPDRVTSVGRRGWQLRGLAALTALLAVAGSSAQPATAAGSWIAQAPMVRLSPTSGLAGSTVAVNVDGFTENISAHILWGDEIRDTFTLNSSGAGGRNLIVPISASPGAHVITVCATTGPAHPCLTGEFEQLASAPFTVIADPPVPAPTPGPTSGPAPGPAPGLAPAGRVDYQVIALEVTQGVRGHIPTRRPDGLLALPADETEHVANRPTVVRAYPWVQTFSGGVVQPVSAYLEVRRPGLPAERIRPVTALLLPVEGREVGEMRGNAAHSFNFILPARHTAEGSTSLRVVINPAGDDHAPESSADLANNTIYLPEVQFRVVQRQPIQLQLVIADLAYRDAAGDPVFFLPTSQEVSRALAGWLTTWPIDPTNLRISYHWTQVSQAPPLPDGPPFYTAAHPREVTPPIPGYPPVDDTDYMMGSLGLRWPGVRSPYDYTWLAFDHESWIGCTGVGYPFLSYFESGTCWWLPPHEAAHTLNFGHSGSAHGELGDVNTAYPGRHGEVEAHAYGFDVFALRAHPPTQGSNHRHDFMSYGAPTWVSLHTWDALVHVFDRWETTRVVPASARRPLAGAAGSVAGIAPAGEYLRVSGGIASEDSVYLDPLVVFTTDIEVFDGPGSGEYSLILRGADGGVLAERAFEPVRGNNPAVEKFLELIPFVTGIAQLEVRRDGQIIGTRSASPQPPAVALVSPSPGDRWEAEGHVVVRWEGSGSSGEHLTYRVQVSSDGQHWHTVHGATAETEATVNLAHLPGSGTGWRVRVQASDGLNVAIAEADQITIAPKPPIPIVLSPLDGTFIGTGGSLRLLGQAYDVQDGHLSEVQWLLDGQPLAIGEQTETGPLAAGVHTLALAATNSAGLRGVTELTIVVGADSDGDRLPDAWESEMGLDPNNPDDAAEDLDGDGTLNWEEYQLGTDPRDPTQPALTDVNRHLSRGLSGALLPVTANVGGPAGQGGWLVLGAVLVLLGAASAAVYRARRSAREGRVNGFSTPPDSAR
jgi:hypothetical protein